jgi:hypothetical protein
MVRVVLSVIVQGLERTRVARRPHRADWGRAGWRRLTALASILVMAALLAVLMPGPAAAQIQSEVSDITGVRTVKSQSLRDITIRQYEGDDAGIRARYRAGDGRAPVWSLAFYCFTSARTTVSEAQQIFFTVDGESLLPDSVSTEVTQMPEGDLLELKRAYLPLTDFQRVAQGDSVSVTIGTAEFFLAPETRQDLRLILRSVNPRTLSEDGSGRRR